LAEQNLVVEETDVQNKLNDILTVGESKILEISDKLRIHRKKLIAIYFFDDNYDISYCSLNQKYNNIPYVIKYIYEDNISLHKISKYKNNEKYILSLISLVNSYNEFILNTNSFNHDNTNKFIIGLKQFQFNNYKLQNI
jgi:hypothetical protein